VSRCWSAGLRAAPKQGVSGLRRPMGCELGARRRWTFANGHLEIWNLTDPNQATKVYSLDYTGAPHMFGPERQQGLFVADQHGVWFGASDGLYLYDSSGFHQAATVSGIPAGPCE